MDDSFTSDSGFNAMFTIMCVIFACILIFGAVVTIRNWSVARKAGYDPLAMETQMAIATMDSKLLAPTESIEERLAKIDDLLARGVITEAEHTAGRAEIIRNA